MLPGGEEVSPGRPELVEESLSPREHVGPGLEGGGDSDIYSCEIK